MSAKALQAQQDVSSALKKIEGDIHEFAGCIQRAQATVNKEDQERCRKELETLSGRLQEHRSEIRRWSTSLDARTKGRLGAARARIEQELRRFKVVEERLRPKVPSKKSSDAIAPGKDADAGDSAAAQLLVEEQEAKAEPAEVKVLVEQVMEDGSGKSEMREDFVCKICLVHLVGCRPKLTSCSHLFCGDCLEKWFAVQPGSQSWARRACNAGTVPCPVCKEQLHEERDLYPVGPGGRGGSALLWQMLTGMPVICANHPKVNPKGKCDWRGEYGSYEEHIRSCQNVPFFSASTSPTVTPDFTPAACLDENFARLRLDSAGSEDSFISEAEEVPAGPPVASEPGDEPAAAQRVPTEDLVQKPQPSAEVPASGGPGGAPTSPVAPSAGAESSDKTSPAEQGEPSTPQDVQETAAQETQSSAAPEGSSMSDLTSLLGALYALKVREKLQLQQEGGAGGSPAQTPARSPPEAAPPGGAEEASEEATEAAPEDAEVPVEVPAEAGAAGACEPERSEAQAAEPQAPKAERKRKTKPQEAATAAAPAAGAPPTRPRPPQKMSSAQAIRMAQLQAAQWQMAQAAWFQQQQWQAAQWQAAYGASLGPASRAAMDPWKSGQGN